MTGGIRVRERRLFGDILFSVALVCLTFLVAVFLLGPTLVVIGASFTASEFIAFPPKGISLRWFKRIADQPELLQAVWMSIVVGGIATLLAVGLGVAAAFPLARVRRPGITLLGAVFLSPLLVPTICYGLAVLIYLNTAGLRLSFLALVLAHVTIVVPYVVRTTLAALHMLDLSIEQAATSLGASNWRVFWHVILPSIAPAVATGAAFAFLTSFDNLTVSLFLVGPRTETLPIRIYSLIEYDIDPVAAAISAVVALVTLLVVIALERVVDLSRLAGS